ncbi:MAG: ribosome biogenesis GTP-binding protein YihA/YsxC [Nitrospirota bacterium]|nr:ribosome biogenesis GTP-binding protein YihA/YsxC [Nitrospirota bacterium]
MSRKSVAFWGSAVDKNGCPKDRLAQIAFVGRSNVGKSSLINTLLGRKGLVKTSSVPGKTQLINFFKINERFYFVDLPGYGYAHVPKAVKEKWGPMIEGYLLDNEPLRAVILLLDIRHQPTVEDMRMHQWLEHHRIPSLFAVTKADKLSRGQRQQRLRIIATALGVQDPARFFLFSSETGEGKAALWGAISRMLENPVKNAE